MEMSLENVIGFLDMKKHFFLYSVRDYISLIINYLSYKVQLCVDKNTVEIKHINDLSIHAGFKVYRYKQYYIHMSKSLTLYSRKQSSDLFVFKQIFLNNEYEAAMDIVSKMNVVNVIDCGANIGLSSIYIKSKFPKSKLCAIEPFYENYEVLQKNINQNNIEANTLLGAIWYKKCALGISNSFRDGKEWSIQVVENANIKNIQSYTIMEIMEIMNFNTIDLLKVDIEGSEKQLFDDSISDLTFLTNTKAIVMEIHDEYNCRKDIYKVLYNNNFEIHEIGELIACINNKFKS